MDALIVAGVTMTSLEMVDYINAEREEGETELRHRDFTAKVPKVLGEEMCEKFRASFKDFYGRDQPGYAFPKREACLMAMSYSYELQAKVFDKMTALEALVARPVSLSRMDILKLAMESEQRAIEAEASRDLAIATKSEIGARRFTCLKLSPSSSLWPSVALLSPKTHPVQHVQPRRSSLALPRRHFCEKDAAAGCEVNAADRKLNGAAKNSFTKKCVKDSVG